MTELHREVAKVRDLSLGYEGHGILTCMVDFDFGRGHVQGAGGYALDCYDEQTKERHGTAFGMEWIIRLMRAFGVSDFAHIKGRTVYVLRENARGLIVGIEPLPTERGERFLFSEIEPRSSLCRDQPEQQHA